MVMDDQQSPAFRETVDEITRIFRSLPPRPSIEEVEAAMSVVETLEREENIKIEDISKENIPQDVPEELFSVLQQARKTMVLFQNHQHRREALHLIELDKYFQTFDYLIQKASLLISGDTQNQKLIKLSDTVEEIDRELVISDQSLVRNKEDLMSKQDGLERFNSSNSGDSGKLSLIKVAAFIENTAKSGSIVLDLRGKLVDQVEWLPLSIGKLSDITELDLSENRIMALPPTFSGLKALTKLDIHSNQLVNLPEPFGELINLTDLDLHANRLRSLPDSFKNLSNLTSLDLSSNYFTHLPEIIGNLTSLKRLNVETNDLEDLPYTIGSCTSLVVLKLDFNQLKALPEAIGKLESLEILTLHYNRIKGLPTTIGNLSKLKELDICFNELESIPENLCFATSLKKLNVGKNFADLRALPRSIGNLEMLEELDISDNQINVLPDSFRFLSKLRVFRADETPIEVPPREVTKMGAEVVVKYMAELVIKRDVRPQVLKKRRFWFWICSIFCARRSKPTNRNNQQVIIV